MEKKRLSVSVGKEWPDLNARTGSLRSFQELTIAALVLLLAAYAIYAMATGNHALVLDTFDLVKIGLVAAFSWTFGYRKAYNDAYRKKEETHLKEKEDPSDVGS